MRSPSRGGSAGDHDAAWAGKGRRSRYGYKRTIGVGSGSGLVRKAVLTAANVNDTEVADYLICGDEEAVYGDRASSTRARSERPRGMGIKDRIMRRANKHHAKLERWEKRPQRVDSSSASACGEGVRDAAAELRVLAGELRGAGEEHDRDAAQTHRVQPAQGGSNAARSGVSARPHVLHTGLSHDPAAGIEVTLPLEKVGDERIQL